MTIPTLGCFGRGPGRRKNSAARRTAAAEAGQTQSEHVPREHEPRKPRQNAQTAADAAAKATRKTAAQALKQQQAQAAAAAAAALEPSSSAPTGASDSHGELISTSVRAVQGQAAICTTAAEATPCV